ncbi:MAG: ATP-binding protein [Rhizobiaceae bacterium]
MRRGELARSTPFRLAITFGVLFLGAFILSGLVVYQLIKHDMYRQHDQTVRRIFLSLAGTYDDDRTDFLDAVRDNMQATRHYNGVYLVVGSDGAKLVGNMPLIDIPDGWSTLPAASVGVRSHLEYRIFAGPVRDTRLVVGESYRDIEELENLTLGSLAWTSILVLALSLAGGTLIAARAERRLQTVRETMDRVARGDLAARIPLHGKSDDIAMLSNDINLALGRLQSNVEGMRQVSTDIAHDLKTPLNRLGISLEEARRKLARGRSADDDINAADAEVQQINNTFEALLRIAQIESGARRARFERVDLSKVIEEVAELFGGALEDAGMSVETSVSAGPCTIEGDRQLLMQLFSNLVENALRHCPAGTDVRLFATISGNAVISGVEDNGPGIPPHEREKVFQRLYRLERSRTSPGTGLGLSLVRAIVDIHDAHVTLEDASPGLLAKVTFPHV